MGSNETKGKESLIVLEKNKDGKRRNINKGQQDTRSRSVEKRTRYELERT